MVTVMSADLFEEVLELPDPAAQRRYTRLVGLDHVKDRLGKEAALLLNPKLLRDWSERHHDGRVIAAVVQFEKRPPLIVFAGDVGTGKTTLAESFGDPIARAHRIAVRVMRLSLRTRGTGVVGEMTRLLSARRWWTPATKTRLRRSSPRRPAATTTICCGPACAG